MTNMMLFVLLGAAGILLGVAGEVSPSASRAIRLVAAVLGLVVILVVLLR